jgi:hypothetical protein
MVQAIAEGVELLVRSGIALDLPALFNNWMHGSVIRSWLVELTGKALREHPDLSELAPYVEDTGEVKWTGPHRATSGRWAAGSCWAPTAVLHLAPRNTSPGGRDAFPAHMRTNYEIGAGAALSREDVRGRLSVQPEAIRVSTRGPDQLTDP